MKKFLSFFSRKKLTWKKVSINVRYTVVQSEFNNVAWWLANALWEKTGRPLYFAKYAVPTDTVLNVQIAIELDWEILEFIEFFKSVPDHPTDIEVIDVQPCEGSLQHAQAWALAKTLRGKDEREIYDTLHWFYNMLGCGYAQEARMLCEHASLIARNLEATGA